MGDVAEKIYQRAQQGSLPGQDEPVDPGDVPSEYALQKPTAVVRRQSGSGGQPRPSEPPGTQIQEYRQIARTDPHVSEAIDTLVDYLVGSGYSIEPTNIIGTDQEQTYEDIAALKSLVENSQFEKILFKWVRTALVDGTAFLEIVVEDGEFKPTVLPTESVTIQTNEFGEPTEYILSVDGGDDITFAPADLAVLRFHPVPGENFGESLIKRCQEQADMLRDMEIDMARFIATKAYPPIVWKLGSEERPWTQDQIDNWLEEVQNVEPESMLAVGHDVEHEVAGVTSTSSSAGAMKLEGTFNHLMQRIYTALGVPAELGNIETGGSKNTAVTKMPKFDRRIQRYRRIIRSCVRHQVFASINAGNADELDPSYIPPNFEFGQHSSEEERLEADKVIKLVNNGLLTFEAAADRLGIDPEIELPQDEDIDEHITKIQRLAGRGDDIQSANGGGAPSGTGAGSGDAGGEVQTRDNPENDTSGSDSRDQQGMTEE